MMSKGGRCTVAVLVVVACGALLHGAPRASALDPAAVPRAPRGEVNGYLTLSQIQEFFGSLQRALPELVRGPVVLGHTARSRPLDAYCIGWCVDDNPQPDGDGMASLRPGLLLTGMHHSREVRIVWAVWLIRGGCNRYAAVADVADTR
jgi:hypothetical protein